MKLLPLFTCLLAASTLISCSVKQPEPQNGNEENLRSKLLEYRSVGEVCQSKSPECQTWMEKALLCETNLVNGIAGSACTQAEQFRERVTGIELSKAPGAFNF